MCGAKLKITYFVRFCTMLIKIQDSSGVTSSTDVTMPSMEIKKEIKADSEQEAKAGDKRYNRYFKGKYCVSHNFIYY